MQTEISQLFQNQYRSTNEKWLLLLLILSYFPLAAVLFRYYLNISWKNALGITLGSALVNALLVFRHLLDGPMNERLFFHLVLQSILLVFITTFILRIFYRWGTNALTSDEHAPGLVGFQAWLDWPNLALCAAIALTVATMAARRDNPLIVFLISFFVCLCVLVLYPIINTLHRSKIPANPPEDINQARLKILDLLESGKISAEECMELLKAVKEQQSDAEVEMRQDNTV